MRTLRTARVNRRVVSPRLHVGAVDGVQVTVAMRARLFIRPPSCGQLWLRPPCWAERLRLCLLAIMALCARRKVPVVEMT